MFNTLTSRYDEKKSPKQGYSAKDNCGVVDANNL